jgi:hypothetical protein
MSVPCALSVRCHDGGARNWAASPGARVREIGVTDANVSPNHAWRHTFKRRAARAGIEANIRDGMCRYSFRTVADMFEAPSVEDLAELPLAAASFPKM